ncbi:hypothetical protein WMY93_018853 [Mugilogobius chulae]|uniref:Uncharacterized protein n=1 Tax=Mugilogobius chulae TaxID=88201 RepID=A0AAW0NRJ3_9GOBI
MSLAPLASVWTPVGARLSEMRLYPSPLLLNPSHFSCYSPVHQRAAEGGGGLSAVLINGRKPGREHDRPHNVGCTYPGRPTGIPQWPLLCFHMSIYHISHRSCLRLRFTDNISDRDILLKYRRVSTRHHHYHLHLPVKGK